MKQDCTISQPTADETNCFQTSENHEFPEGTHVSEPDEQTGSAIKKCTQANREIGTEKEYSSMPKVVPTNGNKADSTSWSYLLYTIKSKVDRRTAKERWSNPFCA